MAFEYHDFVRHESSARMRECSIKAKEIPQYYWEFLVFQSVQKTSFC